MFSLELECSCHCVCSYQKFFFLLTPYWICQASSLRSLIFKYYIVTEKNDIDSRNHEKEVALRNLVSFVVLQKIKALKFWNCFNFPGFEVKLTHKSCPVSCSTNNIIEFSNKNSQHKNIFHLCTVWSK